MRHFIPECEQHLQKLKKQTEKGLLYGVPVSIKDHIGYKVILFLPNSDCLEYMQVCYIKATKI